MRLVRHCSKRSRSRLVEPLEDRTLFAVTVLVTNTADGGPGSLRAAIVEANDIGGSAIVKFDIPTTDPNFVDVDSALTGGDAGADVFRIRPLTQLPDLVGTEIDARTQAAETGNTNSRGPEVLLDGSLAPAGTDGLRLSSSINEVYGLVIGGFSGYGIHLLPNTSDSRIAGNYVGVNATGTAAFANGDAGVFLDSASGNRIGGTKPEERNVLSGNYTGLRLTNSHENGIFGNYIGTDATGEFAIQNFDEGIQLQGSSDNRVGGDPTRRNVISGNQGSGIALFGGSNENDIEANYIGTDKDGVSDLGNLDSGVEFVQGASNNTVGGGTASRRNILSGNSVAGVDFFGPLETNNVIKGNYIGTDVTGTLDLGNVYGIRLQRGTSGHTIGGTDAGARNVISGNNVGIFCESAVGLTVQGNYVGTNAAGTGPLANAFFGIEIESLADSLIGGTTAGAGNVISGNGGTGLDARDLDGVQIVGNRVGTNAAGTAALGNDGHGVYFDFSRNTLVGGTNANAGNLISGNTNTGLRIETSSDTRVERNRIGTNLAGTAAIPNTGAGIEVGQEARDTTIGGTGSNTANLIAFNTGPGVRVFEDCPGTAILRNSIFSNGGLGIDWQEDGGPAGVTPNDPDDATDFNDPQNFPVLATATSGGGTTTITGSLNSTPNTTFRVELFSNVAADPSGSGEGQAFLTSRNVTTDANGDVSFSVSVSVAVPLGQVITATATSPVGNTSEFSATRVVTAA